MEFIRNFTFKYTATLSSFHLLFFTAVSTEPIKTTIKIIFNDPNILNFPFTYSFWRGALRKRNQDLTRKFWECSCLPRSQEHFNMYGSFLSTTVFSTLHLALPMHLFFPLLVVCLLPLYFFCTNKPIVAKKRWKILFKTLKREFV